MIEIHVEPLRRPELADKIIKEIRAISKNAEFRWDYSLLYDEKKYGFKNEIIDVIVNNKIDYELW